MDNSIKLYSNKIFKSNKGSSLIELITVIGVFSIIAAVDLPRFLELINKAEQVIAANKISSIKIECESNSLLGRNLIFSLGNLIGYIALGPFLAIGGSIVWCIGKENIMSLLTWVLDY